jgi:hypothetical protein
VHVDSAFCRAALELELAPTRAHPSIVLASGLAVGDCVDVPLGVHPRLCCATTPRTCGKPARALLTTPACNRVLTP